MSPCYSAGADRVERGYLGGSGYPAPARRGADPSAACSVSEWDASRAPRGCPQGLGPLPRRVLGGRPSRCRSPAVFTGHLFYKFGITESDWYRIKQSIDSKCRTAWRRKQRGQSLAVKSFSRRTPSSSSYSASGMLCPVPGARGRVVVSTWSSVTRGPICVRCGRVPVGRCGGPSWKVLDGGLESRAWPSSSSCLRSKRQEELRQDGGSRGGEPLCRVLQPRSRVEPWGPYGAAGEGEGSTRGCVFVTIVLSVAPQFRLCTRKRTFQTLLSGVGGGLAFP